MDEIFSYTKVELNKVNNLIINSLHQRDVNIRNIGHYLINSGGKRLRPIFTILSAKLFNYEEDKHIYVATSVELIHTATLLHDDVVDESKTRRGKKTVNHQWSNKYAILVGDFLFSQAFKMMVSTDSLEVLNILSNASSIISEGEVKQLASIGNFEITKKEYYDVISGKTAELFAAACKTGAIISNQDENTATKLYDIGLNAGIAFQIIDDLLDYTANEKSLGKSLGDDFYENKITLPVIILYQKSSTQDKQKIKDLFTQATPQAFENLLTLIEKYGVINLVKEEAQKHIDLAVSKLDSIDTQSEAKNLFIKLLKQQIERLY